MARKCVRCMRGTAHFMIEMDEGTHEYICHRCYVALPVEATLIPEDDDG